MNAVTRNVHASSAFSAVNQAVICLQLQDIRRQRDVLAERAARAAQIADAPLGNDRLAYLLSIYA